MTGGVMTDVQTEELTARRLRVAASNRAFGRVLLVVGVLLLVVALLAILAGAGVYVATANAVQAGADRYEGENAVGLAAAAMTFVPAIALVLATCALVLGEQLRRGFLYANPTPPDTVLPSASYRSRFRVLGFGWHLLWTVVASAIALVLIGIPTLGWIAGIWPSTMESAYNFTGFWVIYGSLALGIGAASAVSMFKKWTNLADVSSGRATPAGGRGRTFWRWVDYRWRFDLWLAGVGGVAIGLSATAFYNLGPYQYEGQFAETLPGFALFAVPGVVLVVLGAVAARQFWRSGEPLGSAESAA